MENYEQSSCLGTMLGATAIILGLGSALYFILSRDETLKRIDENTRPQIQVKNVIGNETPDKFYQINGQRVYLEVDGKSIEKYFTPEAKE